MCPRLSGRARFEARACGSSLNLPAWGHLGRLPGDVLCAEPWRMLPGRGKNHVQRYRSLRKKGMLLGISRSVREVVRDELRQIGKGQVL